MRLTTVILLATLMQVSAATFGQRITINQTNVSLKVVLKEIRKQSGYDFFYDGRTIPNSQQVSVSLNNATIDEALSNVFRGLPFSYEVSEKNVTIKRREEPSFLEKVVERGLAIDVTGRVTDENNQPLAGATVQVKGQNISTSTDANGFFILKQVPDDAIIVIAFIGYDKKELPALVNVGQVNLISATNPLDEVKVIAYGITTQRLSTGNVVSIKSADIDKQPVNNPLLTLAGRIPGILVTQANGLPGSAMTVRVQGSNSIAKGNDPLYVIDGVPFSSQLASTGIGTILGNSPGGATGNPMSFINPTDIQSIEVLKDADATAIYGSRAANGAILITTKKGSAGEAKVNVNLQQGIGRATRKLDFLNTQQYIQMRKEAISNDGETIGGTDYDINGFWDQNKYTDWQKVLIGGTASYTDIQTSVSGGSNTTQFLVGGGFHKETTVFPGESNDQKSSMHFNLKHNSTDNKFNLQLGASYLFDNNNLLQSDLTNLVFQFAPNAPDLYNVDGTLNWAPNASGSSTWFNPLKYLYQTYTNKSNNLISNLQLSYKIGSGFSFSTNLGYTDLRSNEFKASPLIAIAPERRPTTLRTAQYQNSSINSWSIEPQVNYQKNGRNYQFQAFVGAALYRNNTNGLLLNGSGYSSDAVLWDYKSASLMTVGGTVASQYRYAAVFSRTSFNWKEKYLLNATVRRDGSSRFGAQNQFHNFWAVGAGWIFTEEKFLKDFSPLNFGKLRASYGTTGNDQIGDYQFMNLFNPINNFGLAYQGGVGLEATGIPNPYLQWEETKKLAIGLDLQILNRITLSAGYYQNTSSNQILPYGLPIIAGFSNISSVNLPAIVRNSGLEVSIDATMIQKKDFSWKANFNLTQPTNKLVEFANIETSSYNSFLAIGHSLTISKVYNFAGVDPVNGKYLFINSAGLKTSEPNFAKDRTEIVDLAPKYYGGFGNTINYKGLQLDFLFQFVKQIGKNTQFGLRDPGTLGSWGTNQPLSVLARWQKPGDNTIIQRFNANYDVSDQFDAASGSNAAFSDASYIRLKNLSITYRFSQRPVAKALKNLQLVVRGQNLLTLTSYKGLDPETRSFSTLPPLKVLTLGLKTEL